MNSRKGLMDLQQSVFRLFIHDLLNEVMKTSGFGEILLKLLAHLEGLEDEKLALEVIIRSTRKMDMLVHQYKELYGEMNLEAKTDIALAEEKAFLMLQQDVETSKEQGKLVRIEINYPETFMQVPQLFFAVFYNMFQNSIKHSKQSNLVISVQVSDNKIIVKDNGQGIIDEQKPILFQKDHGLGIVKKILNLTGFNIEEKGKSGQGACFEIEFTS